MYEVYQDHPKQAKGSIRVVLAVAFLVCAIGAGIFLITRLVSKPLSKEEARDGASEGNLMLVNESINNYPQKVQIVRNDTGEQIYESGAIAIGSKIERAKLDVDLPAGTYECTAYFHNLNPETGDIIGTAGAIITITVKN